MALVNKRRLVLVAHNIRSCHNVGSLLRSADSFGVEKVYLTGYTPYPAVPKDKRLPHLQQKISRQIHKTALGAEETVAWQNNKHPLDVIARLGKEGFLILALEQSPQAKNLTTFKSARNVALIVGNEITGIEPNVLEAVKTQVQIPMLGAKESLNVSVAAAIGLYHLRFLA